MIEPALCLAVLLLAIPPPPPEAATPGSPVVFICEHGSAKSVVAASYFNAIAERRGLPWRAVARGTAPEDTLPLAVVAGLARAGVKPATEVPVALAPADLAADSLVVAFLPVAQAPHAEQWQVPAVSADFDVAREEIVRRVEDLLDRLAERARRAER